MYPKVALLPKAQLHTTTWKDQKGHHYLHKIVDGAGYWRIWCKGLGALERQNGGRGRTVWLAGKGRRDEGIQSLPKEPMGCIRVLQWVDRDNCKCEWNPGIPIRYRMGRDLQFQKRISRTPGGIRCLRGTVQTEKAEKWDSLFFITSPIKVKQ